MPIRIPPSKAPKIKLVGSKAPKIDPEMVRKALGAEKGGIPVRNTAHGLQIYKERQMAIRKKSLAARRYANAVGPTAISLVLLADDRYELMIAAFGKKFKVKHRHLPTLLALMGWGGQTLIAQGERVTRVEQGQEDQGRRLGRIEWKIDRLLERRP